MDRIILHWTAGADGVTPHEADSYNFVIGRDGTITPGEHPPEAQPPANVARGSAHYAAHTRACNSNSIGVSLDAMADAVERPFSAGRYPITELQIDVMATFVADLCRKYRIPVTRRTVLSLAEVQPTLGIRQNAKWDISWLPGMDKPGDPVAVGDQLRARISSAMGQPETEAVAYTPLLRLGSKGDAVKYLQSLLAGRGSDPGPIDGDFGAGTRRAAIAFQKSAGLAQDGIIGPVTWAALMKGQ